MMRDNITETSEKDSRSMKIKAVQVDSPAAPDSRATNTAGEHSNPLIVEMDPQRLLQGILYAEILGRPKAKRRGRW